MCNRTESSFECTRSQRMGASANHNYLINIVRTNKGISAYAIEDFVAAAAAAAAVDFWCAPDTRTPISVCRSLESWSHREDKQSCGQSRMSTLPCTTPGRVSSSGWSFFMFCFSDLIPLVAEVAIYYKSRIPKWETCQQQHQSIGFTLHGLLKSYLGLRSINWYTSPCDTTHTGDWWWRWRWLHR